MSVLVKGMCMPISCERCRCICSAYPSGYRCGLANKKIEDYSKRLKSCPLEEVDESSPKLHTSLYDTVERHTDCTVEILKNSVTGEISVGWYRNDKPPVELGTKRRDIE